MNKFMGFLVVLAMLAFSVFASGLARAEIYTPWHNDLAIRGYDTVAYFTDHKAIKGNENFELEYQEARWWFASQQNLLLFQQDPQAYMPQFGGHCANGLSDLHKVGADPENWRIIDGKLYLFYSKWGREQWGSNVPEQLKLATDYWLDNKE